MIVATIYFSFLLAFLVNHIRCKFNLVNTGSTIINEILIFAIACIPVIGAGVLLTLLVIYSILAIDDILVDNEPKYGLDYKRAIKTFIKTLFK